MIYDLTINYFDHHFGAYAKVNYYSCTDLEAVLTDQAMKLIRDTFGNYFNDVQSIRSPLNPAPRRAPKLTTKMKQTEAPL